MLKVIVLLLVVINGLFFAWTEGAMPGLGPYPGERGRDPQRWTRQLRPDAVQLMSGNGPNAATGEASALPGPGASASAPTTLLASASSNLPALTPPSDIGPRACLEAGPFGSSEIASVEQALGSVTKPENWSIKPINSPGVWLVYLGTFNEVGALERKKTDLRRLAVNFEEVRSPSDLAPGLSLGRFPDVTRAQERLEDLTRQGVTGARTISAATPRTLYTVRLPHVDATMQTTVLRLNGDPLMGKSFVPCAQS